DSSSPGNSSSVHLISCRSAMSGSALRSHSSTLPSLALIEFTLKVAIFITGTQRIIAAGRERSETDQIEKDEPQPQEDLAFGLRTWNEDPTSSSTKSPSAPPSSPSETSSTTSRTPSRSKTRSSAVATSSKEKPYWNPEQPPPETLKRSIRPGLPSAATRAAS